MRTWHIEMAVVAVILGCAVALSGGAWTEWIGAVAVLASFGHAQVAERMMQHQALEGRFTDLMLGRGPRRIVHCWRWSQRYFVAKELFWLSYFLAHRSWSALAGVAVFLLYPVWRRVWRGALP